MKKILFAALAATMLFASCDKQDNGNEAEEMTTLTVRISGVATTKATEAKAIPGQITLSNARIFVMNPAGTVMIYNDNLNLTAALSAAGEELTKEVPADSRVYILGNVPSDVNAASFTTLAQINSAVSAISSQTSYKTVALANSTGQPSTITVVAKGKANADIAIKPLVSRLELAKLQTIAYTDTDTSKEYVITEFKVAGVYVDSYYSGFYMNGAPVGVTYEQYTSTDFTSYLPAMADDASDFPAIGTPPALQVTPSGVVWAYQVVSAGLPRLLVKLDGIKYSIDGGSPEDLTPARYITVAGYTGVTEFERGKVYRIGGEEGIIFSYEDIANPITVTPNPENLTLTVNVTVEDWVFEDISAII